MGACPNSRPIRRTDHSIVEVPLIGRHGAALPLLLLDEGEVSIFSASYIRNLHFTGVGQSTIHKHVAAIGLLHDFYAIAKGRPTFDEAGLHLFIKQFYEARRWGNDVLGWRPVKRETAENDLWYVSQFSLFCMENFGHLAANPVEKNLVSELSSKEALQRLARISARKRWDMMFHLFGSTAEGQGEEKNLKFRPERGKRRRRSKVEHFPPQHVLPFIASAVSVRDRLCWILIFFGGLRISELCHIYVRDISYNHKTGVAKVILADPGDATISWTDRQGKKHSGTRAKFLLDKYGRIPRDLLPVKHPEHAGWKSMAYESENRLEAEVIWLDSRVGELFYKLHVQYMRCERLAAGDNHPYYFISLKGEARGSPIKLSNLHNRFDQNAGRIGLIPNQDGVNPHAGRHFYGYYAASWLRMSKERVQKMLHHRSSESTEVYYRIDDAVVRVELERAQKNLSENLPAILSAENLLALTENGID